MAKSFILLMPLFATGVLSAFAEDPAARFAAMTPEEVRAFENAVKEKAKNMDRIEAMEMVADLALIPPEMIPEDSQLLGTNVVLTESELDEAATAMRTALGELVRYIEHPGK